VPASRLIPRSSHSTPGSPYWPIRPLVPLHRKSSVRAAMTSAYAPLRPSPRPRCSLQDYTLSSSRIESGRVSKHVNIIDNVYPNRPQLQESISLVPRIPELHNFFH